MKISHITCVRLPEKVTACLTGLYGATRNAFVILITSGYVRLSRCCDLVAFLSQVQKGLCHKFVKKESCAGQAPPKVSLPSHKIHQFPQIVLLHCESYLCPRTLRLCKCHSDSSIVQATPLVTHLVPVDQDTWEIKQMKPDAILTRR